MSVSKKSPGFTLIELMIVIAIVGLISAAAMVGLGNVRSKQRDTRRVANITELQKGLQLYIAQVGNYPTQAGCVDGSDTVSTELAAKGLIAANAKLVDPLYPSDAAKCYFYDGNGSKYKLRYTLESNSAAGEAGDHTIEP